MDLIEYEPLKLIIVPHWKDKNYEFYKKEVKIGHVNWRLRNLKRSCLLRLSNFYTDDLSDIKEEVQLLAVPDGIPEHRALATVLFYPGGPDHMRKPLHACSRHVVVAYPTPLAASAGLVSWLDFITPSNGAAPMEADMKRVDWVEGNFSSDTELRLGLREAGYQLDWATLSWDELPIPKEERKQMKAYLRRKVALRRKCHSLAELLVRTQQHPGSASDTQDLSTQLAALQLEEQQMDEPQLENGPAA